MEAPEDMETIESPSQAEHAYRRLRGEILHGELMPGERLRAADLHTRFQLGLTPIREALMRLASENLVEVETNRGSRVRETSRRELSDIMHSRRAIERLCMEEAIAAGDANWEADILAAMHLLSRAPTPLSPQDRETARAWEESHRRFHFSLISACTSQWLLRFWNTLADHSERYRKMRLLHLQEISGTRDVNAEHADIMDAVLARDIARATALIDAHLQATESAVARLLDADSIQ